MNSKKKVSIKCGQPLESKSIDIQNSNIDEICNRIIERVNAAKQKIVRTIDTEMVKSYWLIGKEIVEEELKGKKRATYGISY